MTATFDQPRIYHISIWRYLVLWWALGPFLLLGVAFAFSADEKVRLAGIVLMSIMSLLLLGWHWLARRSWLEISSRGVRVNELGGGLEVAWTDIIDLRIDRGHEGFITAQPMDAAGARRLATTAGAVQMHDALDLQLIGEQRYLPIKAFAVHLRRGDLRNAITRHAPHLNAALATLEAMPVQRDALTPSTDGEERQRTRILPAAVAITPVLIVAGERSQAWFFATANAGLSPLIALGAGYSAWRMIKEKSYLVGSLAMLFCLVMAGRSVVAWTQLQQLAQSAP